MDLNVLEQAPALENLYTQISYFYPVPDAIMYPVIIDTLRKGLKRLSENFPWVAGQVTNKDRGTGQSGTFKVTPLEGDCQLIVRDLRDNSLFPTMDELRKNKYPFHMLDENLIAPRRTFDVNNLEKPVFITQVNLVVGGLILTFNGHHITMDMTGQGFIMEALSNLCHNHQLKSWQLEGGNLARKNMIPLLENYVQGCELNNQIIKPNNSSAYDKPSSAKCSWCYFMFSACALNDIKILASKSIHDGFVSTDDSLTAFVWQSIIRARSPRLSVTEKSTLSRAVDVRRYMGILTYFGLLQNMTYHTHSFQELIDASLGSIALGMRVAVDPKTTNLKYCTQALATCMSRAPDKGIFSMTACLDLSRDIALSSWSKTNCYELDFNLGLGKPEAVRRPQFTPVESLIYFMPKSLDGEVAVGLCLRDDDMDRLRSDVIFNKYAQYIG